LSENQEDTSYSQVLLLLLPFGEVGVQMRMRAQASQSGVKAREKQAW